MKRKDPVEEAEKAKKMKIEEEYHATIGEITEMTDMPTMSKGKWVNKTRVLIFGSRGLDYRTRHFMQDLRGVMPHSKTDVKLEKKNERGLIKEIAEMKNCSKVLYFEGRKKKDLFLTVADVDEGPTVRFNVEGLNTMGELKFSGNSLKSSRPLLVFDTHFDEEPHWMLIKELFTQTFGTPRYHPKSQPFIDHVLNFSIHDGRIWIRNYQIILEGENKVKEDKFDPELVEIGPRIVLNLQRIQEGPFSGPAIFLNPDYIGPNQRRREQTMGSGKSYMTKVIGKEHKEQHKNALPDVPKHVTDDIFRMSYTVFIGDLPDRARAKDVESFFCKFGRIEQIRLRNRFGFVDFRERRDAEDAVRELNGEKMCGERLRLEMSDGSKRRRDFRRERSHSRSRSRSRGRGGGRNAPHRTQFTLEIENLSSRFSWADLKDYMRQAGEVTYTDAHQRMGKNRGEVCFETRDALLKAKEKFDGEEINGRAIRENGSRSVSRNRSYSRRRSRSRSYSKSRSQSHSGRGSERRSYSGSRSQSRSRSR